MIRLENELNLIQNHKLRIDVEKCLKLCPKTFWYIPTSSSGKHHPSQCNEVGGLITHTRLVVRFACTLAHASQLCQDDFDILIAASLLHDIHKPDQNHAILTYKWLTTSLRYHMQTTMNIVAETVLYHMGQWTIEEWRKPISEYSNVELLLHYADMCSTDKGLSCDMLCEFPHVKN